MQRSIFQNRLRRAEQELGFNFSEEVESENQDEEEPKDITGKVAGVVHSKDVRDSTKETSQYPKWSTVFDENDIFCNNEGYSFQTYFKKPILQDGDTPIVFIGHHGAGSSGLTFGELCKSVVSNTRDGYISKPGFFTFDFRGHSMTNLLNADDEGNYRMDIDTLVGDFKFIIDHFLAKFKDRYSSKIHLFIIGHSLGGSVAIKLLRDHQFDDVKGLVIVDIVEETAIHSLDAMHSYLNKLPKSFQTLEMAINWYVNQGLINNSQSAKLSIPSLLKHNQNGSWEFIVDLRKSKPYWNDWFKGISNDFVTLPNRISKLLVLANNDYLDKPLIIGQMQGKYQLMVFYSDTNLSNFLTTSTTVISDSMKIGHFIHEDVPNKFTKALLQFVERNDLSFRRNDESNSQLQLINKLNAKWNAHKK